MNEQKRELVERNAPDEYSVEIIDVFPTIQGEGPEVGRPSVFIRLAGCNLQCSFCDTQYTKGRQWVTADNLVKAVRRLHPSYRTLVVITGGEPFRQPNVSRLINTLLDNSGNQVQVETNGACSMADLLQIERDNGVSRIASGRLQIVCSPKIAHLGDSTHELVTAWKYVVEAGQVDSDGLPLSSLGYKVRPARPNNNAPIFIQPMSDLSMVATQENIKTAIGICMKFGYRLSMQVHKMIDLP